MNLAEIRAMTMFQMGEDAEDAADYEPQLTAYINEGYDRLLEAWKGGHTDAQGDVTPLSRPRSVPMLPEWTHRALADWAAWQMFLCGGSARQNRGTAFLHSFNSTLARLRRESEKPAVRFRNWR